MARFCWLGLCLTLACSTVDIVGTRLDSEAMSPTDTSTSGTPSVTTTSAISTSSSVTSSATTAPRNILAERLDIPVSQVNALVNKVFLQLFFGDPTTQAVFFDQGDGTGYIKDIANGDVRTDSMAYGMLVTVQLDQRELFDKLWAWTKRHMMSPSGASAGLLRWRCDTTGNNCDTAAATDASSIIATALFMAESRWSNAGAHDYAADGRQLLTVLTSIEQRNGGILDKVVNCFDPANALPRGTSSGPAGQTPVDYLMPAFYKIWAQFDTTRSAYWERAVVASRELLSKAPDATTGLLPEWVHYDATPVAGHNAYRSLTARTLLNLALDDQWFGEQPWATIQSKRRLDFFLGEGLDAYVSEYTTAGSPLVNYNTVAHRSLVAVSAGMVDAPAYNAFLERLVGEPIPTGDYRYYDGMIYMLSLLVLSGQMTPG